MLFLALVFLGALLVFIGNTAYLFWPNVTWVPGASAVAGIVGGALFFFSYLGIAFIALRPAQLTKRNAPEFARAAFNMLASATDEEYVQVFRDIVHNAVPLMKTANFNDVYSRFSHKGPPSAFFDFRYRHQVEQSEYARSLLLLLADERCCKVLVRNDPMTVVTFLRKIADESVTCRSAKPLVQQLAAQSVLLDDSMLAREAEEYEGFGSVRVFIDAMFREKHIVAEYTPFSKLEWWYKTPVTEGVAKRLIRAAQASWEAAYDDLHPQYLSSVNRAVISASQEIVLNQLKDGPSKGSYLSFYYDLARILKDAREHLASMQPAFRRHLYGDYPSIAKSGAELAHAILKQFSWNFRGPEDSSWHYAVEVFHAVYPHHKNEPRGCDPLQYSLAVEMVADTKEYMSGYAPSAARVFLAVVGPYNNKDTDGECAFQILRDAMYSALRGLKELSSHDMDKVSRLLPDNVTYDPACNSLTYTYRSGGIEATKLDCINPMLVDFEDTWIRVPEDRDIRIDNWCDPIC